MQLVLDEIQSSPVALDHRIDVRLPRRRPEDPTLAEPVAIRGEARRGTRGVELDAAWKTVARVDCSRCLEPLELPLEDSVRLILVPGVPDEEDPEKQITAEDAAFFPASEGRVDLAQLLAEQVLLALPLKPVCRADCAGLCPTCGVNRNRIECRCRQAEVDPRLAPLLELKRRMSDDSD